MKPLLVMLAFIIIASFSTFYQNFFRSPINFELMKFFTVISGAAYGSAAGIMVGASSVVIGRALSGRLDQDTITSIIGICIVAVLASAFREQNIAFLGIALVLAYYALISFFVFLFGKNLVHAAFYITTNIAINAFLFINFGQTVLNIALP
ncbi:hypothetical protein HY640_05205 [Candidatus Woesearchaeota archaeon]|nr:hypothetical protein [Candidatus Woesearchaeota archaeon]